MQWPAADRGRVGYVLTMYPRVSETFILNEILAHEAAGCELEIFSLRLPTDGRFHEALARVQAPVTYLPNDRLQPAELWETVCRVAGPMPDVLRLPELAPTAKLQHIHQAMVLAEAVRERGIDHLHAHFATVATTVTRLAARLADVPYSFTAHAKDIFHESVEEQDLREKLRDARSVITVSDFNVQHLRERFGPDASAVQRIYNGLDLDEFPYAEPRGRRPLVMALGRLVEKKGFGVLVDACAVLAERGRDFQCEIVGGGKMHRSLDKQIRRLELSDRVRLLGAQPRWQVIERLQEAAVLAAPCVVGGDGNRDGLPTVLLEAMALGTPCISTPVTGIPEVIHDGITGLMVPERDPVALADAIARLLDDEDLGVRVAGNARRLVEAEFDIHRNTGAVRRLFAGEDATDQVPSTRVTARVTQPTERAG